ncbi:MAG: hypothetical protein AAF310_04920 [Myxococcota bacterium]
MHTTDQQAVCFTTQQPKRGCITNRSGTIRKLLGAMAWANMLSLASQAIELPGNWTPAPQLGNGYNSNKSKVMRVNCMEGDIIDGGQSVGSISYGTNVAFDKMVSDFSGSASASFEVPFVKGEAAMKYAQHNAASNYRMNWYLYFNAT